MSAKPLLIGHSHVHAPLAAARQLGLGIDGIAFWDEPGAIEVTDNSDIRFRPDVAAAIARQRPVFAFIGCASHTVLALVEHHRPFDCLLPDETDDLLDLTREWVPISALRAALETLNEPHYRVLKALIEQAGGPVMQIGPPPPTSTADPGRDKYPWKLFPDRPRAFAPARVRLKVWRLAVELIRQRCEQLGITFVPAPSEAADAHGFLKAEYRQDVAHANAEYGALILRELGLS